jgi:hypothetical protein
MAYSPTELLTVYLDARGPSSKAERRKVGRFAFKDRQILFEYDASSLASVFGGTALWNFAIGTCRSLRRLNCGAIESMQANTVAR